LGLTGNALEQDVAAFKEAGCDEVLTKPLSFARMKVCIEKYGMIQTAAE